MSKPLPQPCDELFCDVRTVHLDRVIRARKEAVSGRLLERLALTYKILGDPTRLRVVMALKSGEMCVCDLAAFIGVSESAVSHQLRRLRDLTLVKNRRDGQTLYYSLDDDHVSDLIDTGLEHLRE
ncbi:MAG: winged helix-turn-helix transcriptional regulator [Deltaproteobacteria bacterium]|nr:winged helix-turn-helix transcriptional regulator [Deltaproteobacteria bacterium]MBW2613583.1 winged helix-turn-helix transcriptional regulator [Deltaproteobacteria bacterium]MBW2676550.1 winged helix-turn-helix transcriptional regulator [Deltaproteobacteria bacterium]